MQEGNRIYKYIDERIKRLPEHYQDYFYSLNPEEPSSRTTIKSYLSHLVKLEKVLGKPLLGKKDGQYIPITKDDCRKMRLDFKNIYGYKNTSINAYFSTAKSMYKYWVDQAEILDRSPITSEFHYKTGRNLKEIYITEEHIEAIKEHLQEQANIKLDFLPDSFDVSYINFQALQRQAIIRIIMDTGIRVSEAVKIRITDFKEADVVIDNQKHKKWQIRIKTSKKQDGGYFYRWVSVDTETKKCVDQLIYIAPTRMKSGLSPISSTLKSMNLKNPEKSGFNEISRIESVRRWVSDIRDKLNKKGFNIPELSPHAFRHLVVTRHVVAGANVLELQQVMGWSSASSAEPYIHDSPQIAGALAHKTFGF